MEELLRQRWEQLHTLEDRLDRILIDARHAKVCDFTVGDRYLKLLAQLRDFHRELKDAVTAAQTDYANY
jgi:hypothetical protein